MQHLLFLNARRRVFFVHALKRYLQQENLPIGVASTDTDRLDPIGYFVDCFAVLPPVRDEVFPDSLCSFIEAVEVVGLMLWNNHDFRPIAAIRNRLERMGVRVLIPPVDLIDVCFDKRKMAVFLKENRLPTPEVHEDIDAILRKGSLPYPLIVKPYDGAGNMHVYQVANTDELAIVRRWVPHAIAQRYILGTHYTVDVFNDMTGTPISVVPRRRIKVRDAEVVIAQVEMKPIIIEIVRKLAAAFGEPGPMNVQLIEDENGKAYVIDMHPRIGGGTDLTIQAGAPFHAWTAQLLLGKPINPKHTVQDGLIMTRYFASVFIDKDGNPQVKPWN
jgi:carbamoyl-phosphate synthase large subunit